MSSPTRDAVVIGAGPNGLVAANHLADAGWDVLLLEAQDVVGGAVRSDDSVAPGFVHDMFSSFYPLSAMSPTVTGLHLEDHGLTWVHAPAVLGNPDLDGNWGILHRDVDVTAAGLDRLHPGDGDVWRQLYEGWQRIGPAVVESLMSPFPPVRGGLHALTKLKSVGGLSFVRMLLEPAYNLVGTRFGGDLAGLLLAGNSAHADIPPDATGSGVFGWLLAMLGQDVGFPVPQGGAGELTAAMARRFESRGGEIRCGTRVTEVVVENRRAVAVRTANDERIDVGRAVIADVAAPLLYGGLVPWEQLPARTRDKMRDFDWDPGTVKVDWALDGPIPWDSTPEYAPGTVHLVDSLADLMTWSGQLGSRAVPANPFCLLGQMTTTDPTRSPAGTESVWAYTHVPQLVRSDAGGEGIRGVWDSSDLERMADRMQRRVETFAPGFADRIVARRILGPHEMETNDANLVGGAINGGTSALHQQLVFRPVAGLGRAETPVHGLFLGSASAHPGGGVHGACGMNAARAALAHDRIPFRR